ncbi:MAG: hypothetical protein QOJ15_11273, partial [Bradyrhizobium sp.]|nr:hypothetical protein [Bradyrhizobium sp.]
EAFRQQRRLLAIRPLNETLHHFPRRFSKRIIASARFSHSLDPEQTWAGNDAARCGFFLRILNIFPSLERATVGKLVKASFWSQHGYTD